MDGDDLLQRLRDRDFRLTAQRRVVAEALAGAHVHRSAEEVHAAAAQRLPEISRATVYNTLNELVALGEVREVQLGGRSRLYDPNPTREHQHLVCDGCGAVVDVIPREQPALEPGDAHGYAVDRAEVTFRGLCPNCR
jgi:Fur family transcriptional regulator, stress-responsive regulator